MSPVVRGTPCPNRPCLAFIVPAFHPKEKARHNPKTNLWELICPECGEKFSVPEEKLVERKVSAEWLGQRYPDWQRYYH